MSGLKFAAVVGWASTLACAAGSPAYAQGFVNGNVGFAQGGFNNGFAGNNGFGVRQQFGVANGFNGTVNTFGGGFNGGFGGYPYGGYGYATPPMTANAMIPLGGAIQSQVFRRPRRR